ncbi:MAG: enterotoxin [Acidobacteriota bacterium]
MMVQGPVTLRSTAKALTFLFLFCAICGGRANAAGSKKSYKLRDARIAARFKVLNGGLRVTEVEDLQNHAKLQPEEAFSLEFRDGTIVEASQMRINSGLVEKQIVPVPNASRAAERLAGRELCADLSMPNNSLTAHWCAILRNGTNYLRQKVTLKAGPMPVNISQVRMLDFNAPGAQVVGKVPGSPIVAGNFFMGFEFPLSMSEVKDGRATSILTRILPLEPGNSITYSSVIGVTAPGQMRRDFLAYVEEERAHPYRTFLHYNSWYDLGEGERYTEAQALDRVHAFGEELVRKRSVTMDSFLFDDGWDNTQSLWGFDSGLPNGFTKIHEAAKQYGFGIGVWMSPWGGYAEAKKERIAAGEKAGYETVKGGFALSAPKYYHLFESTCLQMITKYGVNQFKFDGTGNASTVFPGSIFDSDFSAMIHLIGRLRQQEPNIFINLTTGTRPSPFWLRYADSIWRGGYDHNFDGVGTWRQKWITYRDEATYRDIVVGGPLYPLNSLMLHGLIYAQEAKNLSTDPGNDFPDEVHDYFGTGTQLQEMYITPSLLSKNDWDVLAESARWSRANAAVLKDTHWIGGDPGKLEVYGWAAWTQSKGIVTLRNPSDHAQDFTLDVGKAFELPAHAARVYRAHSPWVADEAQAALTLRAGQAETIHLAPFQVLTLDAVPVK